MTNPYDEKKIEVRPIPSIERFDNGAIKLEWFLVMFENVGNNLLEMISQSHWPERAKVTLQPVEGKAINMSVRAEGENAYTIAWDTSFLVMSEVERCLGSIDTIEGVSREKWQSQFIISQHIESSSPCENKDS